jgi:hypothetical protein
MRPLGRHTRRWENNIKIDFKETDLEDVDTINLVQDMAQLWALVNTAINLRIP